MTLNTTHIASLIRPLRPKLSHLYCQLLYSCAVAIAAAWLSVYEIDTLTCLMPAFFAAAIALPCNWNKS